MKVAFIVLILAAAALADHAGDSVSGNKASGHNDPEPVCEIGEDCVELCNTQCYNSVDALCIDGSCMCEVEPVDISEAKVLKKVKAHH